MARRHSRSRAFEKWTGSLRLAGHSLRLRAGLERAARYAPDSEFPDGRLYVALDDGGVPGLPTISHRQTARFCVSTRMERAARSGRDDAHVRPRAARAARSHGRRRPASSGLPTPLRSGRRCCSCRARRRREYAARSAAYRLPPPTAAAGLTFYSGGAIPQFDGNLSSRPTAARTCSASASIRPTRGKCCRLNGCCAVRSARCRRSPNRPTARSTSRTDTACGGLAGSLPDTRGGDRSATECDAAKVARTEDPAVVLERRRHVIDTVGHLMGALSAVASTSMM